jgi:hypothetical protein
MAGCSYHSNPPDDQKTDNWESILLGYAIGGATAFGIAAILEAGGISGLTGGAFTIALFGIVLAAAAGALVAGTVGYAIYNFNRLFVEDPSTITLAGCVLCAGKNDGIFPAADGDWTFNLGGSSLAVCFPTMTGLDVPTIRTRAAPGSGLASSMPIFDDTTDQPMLHCEISSNIGNYAAVGTAIGTVAGAAAGAAGGAGICAAFALATFGLGGALCLLLLAAATLLGAIVGFIVGDAIGSALGWIADQLSDFNEKGEAIAQGCIVNFTGRWVTDIGHEHNEIHDIASAQLVECAACQTDATGTTSLCLIAAVGIGRHPTGRDP